MTTKTPILVSQETDLFHQLRAVLRDHPAGHCFQLLFTPADVHVADDEILVQEVDPARGVVELHPRKVRNIRAEDVLYASQTIRLTDDDLVRYAQQSTPIEYHAYRRDDGTLGHVML